MRILSAWLIVCLMIAPGWGATALQYVLPGTELVFADSAQTPTVTWTLSNRAAGTGQVSARYDKNALASATGAMPALWDMRCRLSLTGTNVVGATIEFYVATSDGTNPDAQVGTADAAITSDQRRALLLVGVLPVYQTASNTTMTVSFHNIFIPTRYFSLAMWNATGLPTETSTAKHRCTMVPVSPQMQAN